MKLYILRPTGNPNKWEPWYDKAFGFVVRANNVREARKLAASDAGNEGKMAWLDSKHSSCKELTIKGKCEIIIRDFASA